MREREGGRERMREREVVDGSRRERMRDRKKRERGREQHRRGRGRMREVECRRYRVRG